MSDSATHLPTPTPTSLQSERAPQTQPQTQPQTRRGGRWLERISLGCLALAGLVLASCAHCPRCTHGETHGKDHCDMHSGSAACSKCGTPADTKNTGAKAAQGKQASGPAADKRKAKAEAPSTQATKEESLWARPTPPRWR